MKLLRNFLITFAILGIGTWLAPQNIYTADMPALLKACAFMTVVNLVYTVLLLGGVILGTFIAYRMNCVCLSVIIAIIGVIVAFAVYPAALMLASKMIAGFTVHGVWTYIIVTLIYIIANMDVATNTDKKVQ